MIVIMDKKTGKDGILAGPGGVALVVEYRDPNGLTPYARNAKAHDPDQVDRIARQISEFGFDQPIVVDKKGVIVKGHGRQLAAIKLGMKRVPVVVTDLDAKRAMAARIGDNKSAESPWISDILRIEFGELRVDGLLDLTGFDVMESSAIIDGWSSAPNHRTDPDGEDPGLFSRITITCRPQDRDKLISSIDGAIRASGIKETSVK